MIYFVETLQRETEAGSAASGLALAEFNGIGEKLLWGTLFEWFGWAEEEMDVGGCDLALDYL